MSKMRSIAAAARYRFMAADGLQQGCAVAAMQAALATRIGRGAVLLALLFCAAPACRKAAAPSKPGAGAVPTDTPPLQRLPPREVARLAQQATATASDPGGSAPVPADPTPAAAELEISALTDVPLLLARMQPRLAAQVPALAAAGVQPWYLTGTATAMWEVEADTTQLQVRAHGEVRRLDRSGCHIDPGTPWQRPCGRAGNDELQAMAALIALARADLRDALRVEAMAQDVRADGTWIIARLAVPAWRTRWLVTAKTDGTLMQLRNERTTVAWKGQSAEVQHSDRPGPRWTWQVVAAPPRSVLRKPAVARAGASMARQTGDAVEALMAEIERHSWVQSGDVEAVWQVHKGQVSLLGAQWPVLAAADGKEVVAAPLAPLAEVAAGQPAVLQLATFEAALKQQPDGCVAMAIGGHVGTSKDDMAMVLRRLDSCEGWGGR